jgi:hypothetical protein
MGIGYNTVRVIAIPNHGFKMHHNHNTKEDKMHLIIGVGDVMIVVASMLTFTHIVFILLIYGENFGRPQGAKGGYGGELTFMECNPITND